MLIRITDVDDVREDAALCWDEVINFEEVGPSLKALAEARATDRLGYEPRLTVEANGGEPITAPGEYRVTWWSVRYVSGGHWEGYRMPDEEVFVGPFTINVRVEEVV